MTPSDRKQLWHHIRGLPLTKICERIQIRRLFRTDVNRPHRLPLALLRKCHEAGRWLYHSRSSDAYEDGATRQGLHHFIHLVWCLAKPANVRPDAPATIALRQAFGRVLSFVRERLSLARPPFAAAF